LRPWPGGWPLPAAGGRRHHCGRRPTKPVFCSQSEDKGNRTRLRTRFPPPSAKVRRFTSAFGGDRRPTTCLCHRKSTGFARDFRV